MDDNIRLDESLSSAALLIIDVQQGLFERRTPVYRADALVATIDDLARRAHAADVLVIYIRHSNKMLKPGSPGWELHPQLIPREDDLLIDKTHGNAFNATDLDTELKERGIGSLFVTGLVTQGCVQVTCRSGHARGYSTILVSDAHSTYRRDAEKLIADWNHTLSEELDAVSASAEIDFDVFKK